MGQPDISPENSWAMRGDGVDRFLKGRFSGEVWGLQRIAGFRPMCIVRLQHVEVISSSCI
jgi:hypothetical protein